MQLSPSEVMMQRHRTLHRQQVPCGPARPDYNWLVHGRAAPDTGAAVLANVVGILKRTRPARIYTSNGADTHRDHQATFWFVRDASREAGYRGTIRTFLTHTEPLATSPCPMGFTPHRAFVPCSPFAGQALLPGVPWPPPERIALTPAQAARKLRAVQASPQAARRGAYLESFVKGEEVFWPIDPAAAAPVSQ